MPDNSVLKRINRILANYDPAGIVIDPQNSRGDEYSYEAEEIANKLMHVRSVGELRDTVYAVFVSWLKIPDIPESGQRNAGPIEKYNEIAMEIWELRNWKASCEP